MARHRQSKGQTRGADRSGRGRSGRVLSLGGATSAFLTVTVGPILCAPLAHADGEDVILSSIINSLSSVDPALAGNLDGWLTSMDSALSAAATFDPAHLDSAVSGATGIEPAGVGQVSPDFAPADQTSPAVVVDSYNNEIYSTDPQGAGVVVTDLDNNHVTEVPVGQGPDALAVDPNNGDVLVTNYASGTVTVISPHNTVLETVSLGANSKPDAILFDNGRAFVTESGTNKVAEISVGGKLDAPEKVAHTVTVGNNPDAIAAQGYRIYVVDSGSDEVSVLKESSGAVVSVDYFNTGSDPDAIAIDPPDNNLGGVGDIYVTDSGSNQVTVFGDQISMHGSRDYVADKVLATLDVGNDPDAVIAGPTVAGDSGRCANRSAT